MNRGVGKDPLQTTLNISNKKICNKVNEKETRRISIVNKPTFDDSNINWQVLGDYEHLHYSILDVDSENAIADVLFKFTSNEKVFLS